MLPVSTLCYPYFVAGNWYIVYFEYFKTVTRLRYRLSRGSGGSGSDWSPIIRLYGSDRYKDITQVIFEHLNQSI